jgi:GH43 family beta-xylosidase
MSSASYLPPATEYCTNPVIAQRADPWCYKHTDGLYYFTGSVPAYDRIEIWKAPSLRELSMAEPTVVWRKHDQGPMSFHIWAPELHYIGDKWYLYFAGGKAEAIWDIRMYVLENESSDPTQGEWVEKGQIKTDWDSFSLDATSFEHRGIRYLVWAQHTPELGGNTSLYIAELENPWTIRSPQIMLTHPEFEWECAGFHVNEGPAVLKKHGRIFITYSASATDSRYCMGLLTADESADLLNPASWYKADQPVFCSIESGGFGPGHNSFTTSADDSIDLLVYHSRTYVKTMGDPLYDPNRNTMIKRIEWNEDGMPNFGHPVADGPYVIVP